MKIVIPTLRKSEGGLVLIDELAKQLVSTSTADVRIIYDMKRTWNKVIEDNVKADDDYIIMDDDIKIIDPDWEKKLLSYRDKYDVIGCKLLYPNGTIQHFGGFLRANGCCCHPFETCRDYGLEFDMPCPYVTFSVVYIKKEVLDKTYIINKVYDAGMYFEDADFCFRARKNGFRVGVVPVKFIHLLSYTKKQHPQQLKLYQMNFEIFKRCWNL